MIKFVKDSTVKYGNSIQLGSGFALSEDSNGLPLLLASGTPVEAHVLATTSGLGAEHTVSGLTAGQVLRATSATTAAFASIQSGDLPSHTHAASQITAAAFGAGSYSFSGGSVTFAASASTYPSIALTPAAGPTSGLASGQIWMNASNNLRYYDGTAKRTVANLAQSQTFTNKTFSTGCAWSGTYASFAAATTGYPSARLPHGTAPSSPTNGDMWTTTTGLFARINSTTRQYANLNESQTLTNKTLGTGSVVPATYVTAGTFTTTVVGTSYLINWSDSASVPGLVVKRANAGTPLDETYPFEVQNSGGGQLFGVDYAGNVAWAGTFSGAVAETSITDGALLARVADNESISGTWTFSDDPIITAGIRLQEEGGDLTAPAAGYGLLYAQASGVLKLRTSSSIYTFVSSAGNYVITDPGSTDQTIKWTADAHVLELEGPDATVGSNFSSSRLRLSTHGWDGLGTEKNSGDIYIVAQPYNGGTRGYGILDMGDLADGTYGGFFRISSDNGYVDIGCYSATAAHIYTGEAELYFGTSASARAYFTSAVFGAVNDAAMQLGTASLRWTQLFLGHASNPYVRLDCGSYTTWLQSSTTSFNIYFNGQTRLQFDASDDYTYMWGHAGIRLYTNVESSAYEKLRLVDASGGGYVQIDVSDMSPSAQRGFHLGVTGKEWDTVFAEDFLAGYGSAAGTFSHKIEYNIGDSGGTSFTWTMSNGNAQKVNATGNASVTVTPANIGTFVLRVVSDGSAQRTFGGDWTDGTIVWAGGTGPTMPTATANEFILVFLYYDGSNLAGSWAGPFNP